MMMSGSNIWPYLTKLSAAIFKIFIVVLCILAIIDKVDLSNQALVLLVLLVGLAFLDSIAELRLGPLAIRSRLESIEKKVDALTFTVKTAQSQHVTVNQQQPHLPEDLHRKFDKLSRELGALKEAKAQLRSEQRGDHDLAIHRLTEVVVSLTDQVNALREKQLFEDLDKALVPASKALLIQICSAPAGIPVSSFSGFLDSNLKALLEAGLVEEKGGVIVATERGKRFRAVMTDFLTHLYSPYGPVPSGPYDPAPPYEDMFRLHGTRSESS
jgi:hypothetical protein